MWEYDSISARGDAAAAAHTIYADIVKKKTYSFWLENANARRDGRRRWQRWPRHRLRGHTETAQNENWLYFLSTFNAMRRACMMIRFVCGSRRFAYRIHSIAWRKPYLRRRRGIYLVVHFQAIFTQPKKVAMPRSEKQNKKKMDAESFLRYEEYGT